MRKILSAVLGLAIVAGATQAVTLDMWVTKDADNPGNPSIPDDVVAGDVLTIWASVERDGDSWAGISFDLGDTGYPVINNPETVITPTIRFNRWEVDSDFGPNEGTLSDAAVIAITALGLGGDAQDLVAPNTWKLGTVTTLQDVGVLSATFGFGRLIPLDEDPELPSFVTIGGQTTFPQNDRTAQAVLWTPEPTSLVLIALAALAIRRR